MFEIRRLRNITDTNDISAQMCGQSTHPPLRGSNGEYFGHEWAQWRYDTLDERLDELLESRADHAVEILDIGCATGAKAAHFAQAGHQVTALDIVDRSEEIGCRNQVLRVDQGELRDPYPIEFIRADIRELPTKRLASAFDLVHARRVLNFITIDEIDRFVAVVGSLLQHGGVFATSFIATGLDQPSAMTGLSLIGSKPALPIFPGLYAHHFGEVHHTIRKHGLTLVDAFSDLRVEAGLIARK